MGLIQTRINAINKRSKKDWQLCRLVIHQDEEYCTKICRSLRKIINIKKNFYSDCQAGKLGGYCERERKFWQYLTFYFGIGKPIRLMESMPHQNLPGESAKDFINREWLISQDVEWWL